MKIRHALVSGLIGVAAGLLFFLGTIHIMAVHAQAAPPAFTITAALPHTSCPPPGSPQFCFATDGLWQSLNGAAYAQVGVGQAVTVNPLTIGAKTCNLSTNACAFQILAAPTPPTTSITAPSVTVTVQ